VRQRQNRISMSTAHPTIPSIVHIFSFFPVPTGDDVQDGPAPPKSCIPVPFCDFSYCTIHLLRSRRSPPLCRRLPPPPPPPPPL